MRGRDAWLYRKDPDWLQQNRANAGETPSPRASVKWDERDESLKDAVQRTVLALKHQGNGKIRLWQIYQAVLELKAKLRAWTACR